MKNVKRIFATILIAALVVILPALADTGISYQPIVKVAADLFRTVSNGGFRIGATTDTTNGNLQLSSGAELLGRQGGTWLNLAIVPTLLTSQAAVTSTSATYVTLTGMTATPAAGTYLVFFSCTASLSGEGNGDVALHIAAVEQVDTTRNFDAEGGLGSNATTTGLSFQTVVTVNGSQVVDVRFRENTSVTFGVNQRTLILIPIAR